MRTFLSAAFVLALTVAYEAQQAPAPPGLRGRVVTGTGAETKPVRRAKVTLTASGSAPIVTDTDANGAFRFPTPAAAGAKIKVQKPGFVTLDADASPDATLAPLTLTRGGALEGIVTDAAGDPVWNVVVTAHQVQGEGAKPKPAGATKTDDLGRYRIHSLPAGDYLVEAATDAAYVSGVFLMPGESGPSITKGYFPAASAIEDARPVHVGPGRDSSGIDVTFTPAAPVKNPSALPPPPRPDANGTGRIAGIVTDATTGKPIGGVQLLLLLAPGQGPALTNWTRTDAKGRFEYTSLEAKRFTLRFSSPRYITLEYGQKRPGESGTQISLRDGEEFRADMKLPRASAVEGALLDEFGEPAPSVMVQLSQRLYAAGRPRLMPIGSRPAPPSDDRGRYRVTSVPPGDYYVAALAGVYTDANEVGGFAPTYYPGTADAGGATPVSVPFGADATATFALAPARTFTVSGTMVNPDGTPVSGRGFLTLATPDHLRRLDFNGARGGTSPDGSFVLRNVPQGQYTLQGFAPPPPEYRGPGNLAAMPFGWMPVSVGDADVSGLVLRTTPGTTLRGKIVFEDGPPPQTPSQFRVSTFPIEFDSAPVAGGPPPSETRADGTFEVTRQTGVRRIFASGAAGWALKKITRDGIDITDTPVDMRKTDVDNLEVVFTAKATRVEGGVTDDKGPVSDYVVVFFPSDPTKWIDRSRFIAAARPTQQGRFTSAGLPPEEYLAIALPAVNGQEYYDPDFLQQLRINATPFTLTEGASKTLELKLRRRP